MSALIWSPFADEAQARIVANTLLEERLIACANIVPGVVSLFEWEGELSETREVGALFKTHADLLDRAVARIEQLHPYDTPAIIGWNTDAAGSATGDWLAALTGER